ncbi:MAG: AMP-dependent synthetase [Blastocatellia bacterium]|nr:MAG: AMP-dependent synthetase [Blastocatellia bacterium]
MAQDSPIDASPFTSARDFLIRNRLDYAAAYDGFRWPRLRHFNWALDYFDPFAAGNMRPALCIASDGAGAQSVTFDQLAERSNQVANFLREIGVDRRDRILLMLSNVVPLWEIMLAAMKVGAVVSPAAGLLTPHDLADRIDRGQIRHVIVEASAAAKFESISRLATRTIIGEHVDGWLEYEHSRSASNVFRRDSQTSADDPLLLYFTSGTTAKPKMVLHTHTSYPVGHLSTMYWIGLRDDDLHWNISSPGWAKHAWSSFFAPWNAGAAVFAYNLPRFDAKKILAALERFPVTTLCAPPTVWRMLMLEDLGAVRVRLREIVSAGEPLNPEVIERVHAAWGLTIRDGYGQTETTAVLGNSPGQPVKPGSAGQPLPGYRIALLDSDGRADEDGEIAISVNPHPVGLMAGYGDSAGECADGYHHTHDVASRDADGYYWYVGRDDDVFKSSDYRISPFEIESALIEHESVAEAAVVPSPDPLRLSVPKAFITLKPGLEPSRETADAIFSFCRTRMAGYKRVRRIEFGELPKTISGKIRRVELRAAELRPDRRKSSTEFWEEG